MYVAGDFAVYTLVVHKSATKVSVKKVFEVIFKAEVISVNVINVPGKKRRFKGKMGMKSGFKKAIVRVKGEVDALSSAMRA